MKDERFWWALLVRAQEQEASALSSDPRDMKEWSASREVGMQARRELVNLGLSLNELMIPVDDEFLERYRAVRQREQDVIEQRRRHDELVKAVEEFCAKAAR